MAELSEQRTEATPTPGLNTLEVVDDDFFGDVMRLSVAEDRGEVQSGSRTTGTTKAEPLEPGQAACSGSLSGGQSQGQLGGLKGHD